MRRLLVLVAAALLAAAGGSRAAAADVGAGAGGSGATGTAAAGATATAPRHVVTIVLGARDFAEGFGRRTGIPYLSTTLRARGTLLPVYSPVSSSVLPNVLALVSGRRPTALTRANCPRFDCAYAADVATLPGQLAASGRAWKGYVQGLPAPCAVPLDGNGDPFRGATRRRQYLTRLNPLVYFHSLTDARAECLQRVVALRALAGDLRSATTTPAWSLVIPDVCAGGHVARCARASRPAGDEGVERFLRRWVPRILAAPAFERDGLLVILFSGSSTPGARSGALLIGTGVDRGRIVWAALDHYGYLRSMEDLFGLPALGEAAAATTTFQSSGALVPAAG